MQDYEISIEINKEVLIVSIFEMIHLLSDKDQTRFIPEIYTRNLHLQEGFSFPIAASPLTDNGLKENNPLALRVKPGFKRSKALLHLNR